MARHSILLLGLFMATACARDEDAEFAALQQRGKAAMGVDQYTSSHVFEALPDGGRIELQRAVEDSAGVAQIRAHMQHIRQSFSEGNFQLPMFVHDGPVPGTDVMAARRGALTYEYVELPRGGEVRIRTSDADALKAVHAFLQFQRMDHRAGGH